MSEPADKNPPGIRLQIHCPNELLQGNYANLSLINAAENEFVFDFCFMPPQAPGAEGISSATVRSRIIVNPRQAKRFLKALQESVQRYEARFGVIETEVVNAPPIPMIKTDGTVH